MSAPMPEMKVFKWLGNDAKGVPYYLHPLNLVWSDEGFEHDLKLFRQVSEQLAADPAYWVEIIRAGSWRHTLAGCTCLLASRHCEFFDDLCYRFREGSFVSPQIAVTLGLLHASHAEPFFQSILNDSTLRNCPKQASSAYQVLLRLGVKPLHEISRSTWRDFELDDAAIAENVVTRHWDFWVDKVQ